MNVAIKALLLVLVTGTTGTRAEAVHRAFHSTPLPKAGLNQQAMGSVVNANRRALLEPNDAGFLNAVQVYPWSEGTLYRLFTAPGLVSDIALQPGEALVSVAAGDTTRWVIGDTSSGAGAGKRMHILVKPIAPDLRTNLVITTNRRVYLISLESGSNEGMLAISWTYPQDQLIALKAAEAAAAAATPVAEAVAVEHLNFNYRIEGDHAPWTPVRAFDDGTQTFIEFPPDIASGEIPPLFVVGSSGKAELLNYRLSGRYYVVDRLFSVAELRIGEKHQLVVRIVRTGPKRRARKA